MQCDFPFMVQSQMVPDLNSMSHQTHLSHRILDYVLFSYWHLSVFSQALAENTFLFICIVFKHTENFLTKKK